MYVYVISSSAARLREKSVSKTNERCFKKKNRYTDPYELPPPPPPSPALNNFARSKRNELSNRERFFTTRDKDRKSMNPDAKRLSHSAKLITPSSSSFSSASAPS